MSCAAVAVARAAKARGGTPLCLTRREGARFAAPSSSRGGILGVARGVLPPIDLSDTPTVEEIVVGCDSVVHLPAVRTKAVVARPWEAGATGAPAASRWAPERLPTVVGLEEATSLEDGLSALIGWYRAGSG
jgi:hypothetical protein